MTTFAADDFVAIAARLREIERRDDAPLEGAGDEIWWCDDCQATIPAAHVTARFRHSETIGGCGCTVSPHCPTCENSGWVQVYSPWPPAFDLCKDCFNPRGHESP